MEDGKLNPKAVTVTLSHTHTDVTYAARFNPNGLLSPVSEESLYFE